MSEDYETGYGKPPRHTQFKKGKSGNPGFDVILVYDISRWGRFQDADESAYYEYICRRCGISVHYCAEQFANDGSPVSMIVKGVKRAMAGEYKQEPPRVLVTSRQEEYGPPARECLTPLAATVFNGRVGCMVQRELAKRALLGGSGR